MSFFRLPTSKKSILNRKELLVTTVFPEDRISKELQIDSAIKKLSKKNQLDSVRRIRAIHPNSITDMFSYWSTQPPSLYNWMADLFEELIENVIIHRNPDAEGFVSNITEDQYRFWRNHMKPILLKDKIFLEVEGVNGDEIKIGFRYSSGTSFTKAKILAKEVDKHIDELYSNNKWFRSKLHTLKTNNLEWIFPHLMQMIAAGSIFRNEYRVTRELAKDYTAKLLSIIHY